MFLQKLNLNPFFAPTTDSAAVAAIEDKALSKEEAIDFLSEDAEESETLELEKDTKKSAKDGEKEIKKDDKGEKKESEESDDELEDDEKSLEEEIEEELEEPDEDKLELVTPVRKREILAKYPNIFKDFPDLEKSYYRERAFSEILPTIEDAKTAVEKAERLDVYEEQIMSGSTEMLLTAVLNTDKESFNKVVDNMLPTLYQVDQGAYYHVCGNVIKNAIMAMVRDGKAGNNDDLMSAADILNQYMFGTKEFTAPRNLSRVEQKTEKDSEVDEREKAFNQRQFDTALDTVTTKTTNILKATIDKNIDPNESMTDYVRRHASSETLDQVESAIRSDKRFVAVLDKLWEKAANDNYSSESLDRIKSAYLSKAKTLLPAIIKKNKIEALRGLGKRVRDDSNDDTSRKDRKGPLPVGKTRSSSGSPQTGHKSTKEAAKAIPKGMSSYDYLNSD